jgi:hypothetical protein
MRAIVDTDVGIVLKSRQPGITRAILDSPLRSP